MFLPPLSGFRALIVYLVLEHCRAHCSSGAPCRRSRPATEHSSQNGLQIVGADCTPPIVESCRFIVSRNDKSAGSAKLNGRRSCSAASWSRRTAGTSRGCPSNWPAVAVEVVANLLGSRRLRSEDRGARARRRNPGAGCRCRRSGVREGTQAAGAIARVDGHLPVSDHAPGHRVIAGLPHQVGPNTTGCWSRPTPAVARTRPGQPQSADPQ